MTENSKNYAQVEIPKVPRWLSDEFNKCRQKSYEEFITDFSDFVIEIAFSKKPDKEKFDYIDQNKKTIDLAIMLGVWEIDE